MKNIITIQLKNEDSYIEMVDAWGDDFKKIAKYNKTNNSLTIKEEGYPAFKIKANDCVLRLSDGYSSATFEETQRTAELS